MIENFQTLFELAIRNNDFKTMEIIADGFRDLNKMDLVNLCWILISKGIIGTVGKLINAGINVNDRDSTGATPLFPTCRNGHGDSSRLLIKKGIDINLWRRTSLHFAAESGIAPMVKLSLENGADPYLTDHLQLKALHYLADYAEGDSIKIATLLLNSGIDINSQERRKNAPLHLAIVSQKEQKFSRIRVKTRILDRAWRLFEH